MKVMRLAASLLLLGSGARITSAAGITSPLQGEFSCKNSACRRWPASPANGPLFPLLTSLRDAAVELIFGKHPTKGADPIIKTPRALYRDELVIRFNVTTSDDEASLAEATGRLFLDVWAFADDFVDVRLHKDAVAPLLGLLPETLKSSYFTLIPDLSAAVYNSLPSNGRPYNTQLDLTSLELGTTTTLEDNLFFRDYQPYAVIVRWMRLLEAMFPTYVKYTTVGTSFEDRQIPALRVGLGPAPGSSRPPRKTIVVTGGLHAREWISTSTVNYVAWSFITSFGTDPMITKLLDEFDIVFIPIMNPDGVEYTWQVDRLWRKSRQQTNLRYCRGLDLDHAFGYGWDSSVTTSDPCSEGYGGEQPFQAVEAQALAAWARNETEHNVDFVALLDLHSYSQQVLFPYSYSCTVDPPNLENLEELATGIAKAIRLSGGQAYTVTSACEGAVAAEESTKGSLWPHVESGGGSAIDWFYHDMGAHFSYQIKLRDTGSYGFLLPREHIIPTGEEMFDAMKYFGDYLLGNNGIERGVRTKDQEWNEDSQKNPSSQELRKREFVG